MELLTNIIVGGIALEMIGVPVFTAIEHFISR